MLKLNVSLLFRSILNQLILIFVVFATLSPLFSQTQAPDSTSIKSPKKAAYYALAFPGGGQIYNGRPLKAGAIWGAMGLAIWRWSVNADAYKHYTTDMDLPKRRYLEKRNKYAWWIGFIYIYGLIDAVVDAHLEPFNAVMEEELEETREEN